MHAIFNNEEAVETFWLKELVEKNQITDSKAKVIQKILNKNYYFRNKNDLVYAKIITDLELDDLDGYLTYLMSDNGIRALVCHYFKISDLIEVIKTHKNFKPEHLKYLLSENGIIALANSWINIQQAAKMPYPIHLKKLFAENSNGIIALQFKYITPEQVATLNANFEEFWRLDNLLSPKGLTLLFNNKIAFDETFEFTSNTNLIQEINKRTMHLKGNSNYLLNN